MADVFRFLEERGCRFEGDLSSHAMGWFAPDGTPFTLPYTGTGYVDADVADLILADRWIWTGPTRLPGHPTKGTEARRRVTLPGRVKNATAAPSAGLEHVPRELSDFCDENMLQRVELARVLIDRMIPSGRNAR